MDVLFNFQLFFVTYNVKINYSHNQRFQNCESYNDSYKSQLPTSSYHFWVANQMVAIYLWFRFWNCIDLAITPKLFDENYQRQNYPDENWMAFFLIWPSKVTTLIVQYHGRELRKRVTLICKKIHVSYQIGRSGSRQSYSRLNTFQNDVVGAG